MSKCVSAMTWLVSLGGKPAFSSVSTHSKMKWGPSETSDVNIKLNYAKICFINVMTKNINK